VSAGSWLRIRTVVRRHVYVLWRSPHRWFDIAFWPVVDVLLWGSLGVFVASQSGDETQAGVPYLLSGILLFHVLYQSEIAVSTGFMEETWSRNILNLMVTPLTELEYTAGLALWGFGKLVMGITMVALASVVFYSFNIMDVGLGLIPLAALLLACGWVISLFVIGLILRFGQGAEILAWGLTFIVMPLSGVFYPADALPTVLKPVALVLPTTHTFSAARDLLDGKPMPWDEVGWALVGVVVFTAAGITFVTHMLRVFRRRGLVTRYS
jgi:ABC-2 type transport system permease protein